jgi:hypothetical protein
VPQEDVSDRAVLIEGEVALDESGAPKARIPEVEIHPKYRFQRACLLWRRCTIGIGIDPHGDLFSLDDLPVAVGHVVLPKGELAKRNEA